jgi:hypothetical protein
MLLAMALALTLQTVPAPQTPASPAPSAAPARPSPKLYNESADAQKAIDDAITWAASDGIRVLVNWGANDNLRAATFGALRRDASVGRLMSDEYRIVYVDVGHADRNLDLAKKYGAAISAGALPAFTILDDEGKVLAQSTSAALQSDVDPAFLDPKKVGSFLETYKAAVPDAVAPFEAAMGRAKREGTQVFVWFSAPW